MRSFFGISCISVLALGAAVGAGRPPQNSKALSQVLSSVEAQGVAPIVEASFDDGVWEIEGYRGDRPVELHVDPRSLSILSERADNQHERPPVDSLPASEIVRRVEQAKYAPVLDIDWEHGNWDLEALNRVGGRELRVEPSTGKVLSDRADD